MKKEGTLAYMIVLLLKKKLLCMQSYHKVHKCIVTKALFLRVLNMAFEGVKICVIH